MRAPTQSAIGVAFDALIPGDGAWPPASACVGGSDDLHTLDRGETEWLAARLAEAPADWSVAWAQAESAEPERFARLLAALYDAYYRAPPVVRHLAALAEAGPRDPDDRFDPALLHKTRKDSA